MNYHNILVHLYGLNDFALVSNVLPCNDCQRDIRATAARHANEPVAGPSHVRDPVAEPMNPLPPPRQPASGGHGVKHILMRCVQYYIMIIHYYI